MKMFVIFSVLALLFVVGSALALTAIGRNNPPQRKDKPQQGKEEEKSGK